MDVLVLLFQPWRGGSRQMILDDYAAAFALPLLVILNGRNDALLFETPSSLMAVLCVIYTCYLIHSKNSWPRTPSNHAILTVLAGVVAVCITFMPGPRINAWVIALVSLVLLNLYRYILEQVWREFRNSFTPGEILLLAQCAVLTAFPIVVEMLKSVHLLKYHPILFSSHETAVSAFCRTAVISALAVFFATIHQPRYFYRYLTVALGVGLCHLTMTFGVNLLVWLFDFIFQMRRIQIIAYWSVVVMTCLPVLLYYQRDAADPHNPSRGPGTVTRKFFHLVVLAVFVPVLFVDVPLLYLASGLAMAGFIVLETMRLHDIPPLGPLLSRLFSSFRDHQDRGKMLLTHIYLLAACACPVWLHGDRVEEGEDPPLVIFMGLITVAVGDGAAAIFGSKFGEYTPQLSGNKSLAGLLAGLISQILFWLALFYYGVPAQHSVLPVVIAISSLTETFTSHVDNLIIPVYTLLAYAALELSVRMYQNIVLGLNSSMVAAED